MKGKMAFANFTLRFGDEVLLDFVETIVIPAFFENAYRAAGSYKNYFFHDVSVQKLKFFDDECTCIIGRLVKEQTKKLHQRYDRTTRTLVKDNTEYTNALSSFFVLILENHKLIYLPEVSEAPEIEAFSNTVKAFLRHTHRKYVRRVQEERQKEDKKVTQKVIIAEIPYPELSVIPLSSEASLKEFIESYGILQTIEVKLFKTNHEIDPSVVFSDVRRQSEELGANQTQLRHHNASGLIKSEAIRQLGSVSVSGNAIIKTVGFDKEGLLLQGENQKMSLRPIYTGKTDIEAKKLAQNLIDKFMSFISEGMLSLKKSFEPDAKSKTAQIREQQKP